MDERRTLRKLSDRGVTSVQFLLASMLALLLFVTFANLVVVQYGRGALRSALEQGVRSGSVLGSTDACEQRSLEVIGQLLAGRMSDDLVVECSVSGDTMVASGSVVFESWTPLTPDFVVSIASAGALEPPP